VFVTAPFHTAAAPETHSHDPHYPTHHILPPSPRPLTSQAGCPAAASAAASPAAAQGEVSSARAALLKAARSALKAWTWGDQEGGRRGRERRERREGGRVGRGSGGEWGGVSAEGHLCSAISVYC
jgi:hypothetical protein